ncbi:MAG: hypothetical protein RR540_01950 [Oscillospiraceae bacterium]
MEEDFNQINENNELIVDENFIEEVKAKHEGSTIKISDIVTIQSIICVILVILFLLANILMSNFANAFAEKFNKESDIKSELNSTISTIVTKIADFVNSTPNDNV